MRGVADMFVTPVSVPVLFSMSMSYNLSNAHFSLNVGITAGEGERTEDPGWRDSI
jgi:hypothetical protein